MRFKGDKTGGMRIGDVVGPGTDGCYRRITDVWFDDIDGHTYVDGEALPPQPESGNVRYYGSAGADDGPPPMQERLPNELRPR
ncbi:hypothetical protein LV457_02730 [Mycobacterium sp. MYCO198283]|uniref:hypothetical protein n=1 Tax=Mycobacterium sp. MYCO198283 TaxID=2883505 RepID=UPI001E65BBBA|nr:hypothetical protein [Mycobacterium sp. MYCO198283]MCG5431205.1 hypothetical protein [Mycobacterium sp. MYCO198283]